jgi:hypothetical protein
MTSCSSFAVVRELSDGAAPYAIALASLRMATIAAETFALYFIEFSLPVTKFRYLFR